MKIKLITLILSLMGIITTTVNAAASDFNGQASVCVANGYGYCPTTQVCFEDQSLPTPSPVIDVSGGCFEVANFTTNTNKTEPQPKQSQQGVTLPNQVTTDCGEGCIQNTGWAANCGEGCVRKFCQIQNNTKFFQNCSNATCQSPCQEKCYTTSCTDEDSFNPLCSRLICNTTCQSVGPEPCESGNCTETLCSANGTCTSKKCAPKPTCPASECMPSCDVTQCSGGNCTRTNCTTCTSFPDCLPTWSCCVDNCTANGCQTTECGVPEPQCDSSKCKAGCVTTSCGDNCTQTDCTSCSTYPGCVSTDTCTTKNCTADGCVTNVCGTPWEAPKTCQNQGLCTEACVYNSCGDGCTQANCTSCSDYPSCTASETCTQTQCNSDGCKTIPCPPPPTCENTGQGCTAGCSNITCAGRNCKQTNCTTCEDNYPSCGQTETCVITNCTRNGCQTLACPAWVPPPDCFNQDLCVESCFNSTCGDGCLQTDCNTCSDYPSCTSTATCTQTTCNRLGCQTVPCATTIEPTCVSTNRCTEGCTTVSLGNNVTQTTCTACGEFPLCSNTDTCTQSTCTRQGCTVIPCPPPPPPPSCDNQNLCRPRCFNQSCGEGCTQSNCTVCSDYPSCTESNVCTQQTCTALGCRTIPCPPPPTCENTEKCFESCISTPYGNNVTQQNCTVCSEYPSCQQSETCAQTTCNTNGCQTIACPPWQPPPTCENQGLCTDDCVNTTCGFGCIETNWFTCSSYPSCIHTNVCTQTTCNRLGCMTTLCPEREVVQTCQSTNRCTEGCVSTNLGNNVTQSICTSCNDFPLCNNTLTCTQTTTARNGLQTSVPCPTCQNSGLCVESSIVTDCGENCTQVDSTTCGSYPSCDISQVCTQTRCTRLGCQTIPCPEAPTCANTGRCFDSCLSDDCAGNNCQITNCNVCSEYPFCDLSQTCTQTNCTQFGCQTTPCPTCANQLLCIEGCTNTTCGEDCVQTNCNSCSTYPSCINTNVCTETYCNRLGCMTVPCSVELEPTCSSTGRCIDGCIVTNLGGNVTQNDCTQCGAFPFCEISTTCTQTTSLRGQIPTTTTCPTCENTGLCFEGCSTTSCGDDCTQTNCTTCDSYPSCTNNVACTQTICNRLGCMTVPCPKANAGNTCESTNRCIAGSVSSSCGNNCTQTDITTCGEFPFCENQYTCTETQCTRQGCTTIACPPPPTCENAGLCVTSCSNSTCGQNCTQSDCSVCSAYPDCQPSDVCTQTICNNQGCKTNFCPTCENTGWCVDGCDVTTVNNTATQSICTSCSDYPTCINTAVCTISNTNRQGRTTTQSCPTCEDQGLCTESCETSICGPNCIQNNCTACGEYPGCAASNVCSQKYCNENGCQTKPCPAPLICENECQAGCDVTSCGTGCTQSNCTVCTDYPDCETENSCTQTKCTSSGCQVSQCPPPPTCKNQDLCAENCVTSSCGFNCTQTNCSVCSDYPSCQTSDVCTQKTCTSQGCQVTECLPPPTCENQDICTEGCTTVGLGNNVTQQTCTTCGNYPSCTATAVCTQQTCTRQGCQTVVCPPPPTCDNQDLCTETCDISSCGEGCTQSNCSVCSAYPGCEISNSCTQTTVSRRGSTTIACPVEPTCDNTDRCVESCSTTTIARNVTQSICTQCTQYPFCDASDVCTITNCTARGCTTSPCPTCDNTGACIEACTLTDLGNGVTQNNCNSCSAYPSCTGTNTCTQTTTHSSGHQESIPCPPPPTCANTDACVEGCVATTLSFNVTQNDCTTCAAYPGCDVTETCSIRNCTARGCRTLACPEPVVPDCENQNICIESCDTSSCTGRNCTQNDCTVCSSYPSCESSDTCTVTNCTQSGCKTFECPPPPPPPTCDNVGACTEQCYNTSCGEGCVLTNCSSCSSYPSCSIEWDCRQYVNGIDMCECPPEPTCENQLLCTEVCSTSSCAGNNCTQTDCSVCGDFPSCYESTTCSRQNCTRQGCQTTDCTPVVVPCATCQESCSLVPCEGNNCVQTQCETVCSGNEPDTCYESSCQMRNCSSDGTCLTTGCDWKAEDQICESPALPSSCPARLSQSYCMTTGCDGPFCQQINCVSFYGSDASCTSTNSTIVNCTSTNPNSCTTSPATCGQVNECSSDNCQEYCTDSSCVGDDCTQSQCTQICNYSPGCVSSSCTVTNCTEGGFGGDCKSQTGLTCPQVAAPGIQYQCPGESTFNWMNPVKATCSCGIGAGFMYFGDKSDAYGQIDAIGNRWKTKSFDVSEYEPCEMKIANPNHISGVVLTFCNNIGASLMRLQYPNTLTPVEMLNNQYQLQADDDVLIFSIASRLSETTTGTMMWKSIEGYEAGQDAGFW